MPGIISHSVDLTPAGSPRRGGELSRADPLHDLAVRRPQTRWRTFSMARPRSRLRHDSDGRAGNYVLVLRRYPEVAVRWPAAKPGLGALSSHYPPKTPICLPR